LRYIERGEVSILSKTGKLLLPELRFKMIRLSPGLDDQMVAGSQRKERSFMMNHGGGWLSGWMGGTNWIFVLIGVALVILLVVVIIKLSKKRS
jgi:hypothetical protein